MSKMIDSKVWRRCPCFLFLSRRTHWHLPWFGHLLPRIFESAEVAMASTCTWADWRWKGNQQKQQRSYFLGWEKNLWPWKMLLLPPHNWGETSIFSDQFGLLNCKDDVCITSKNATTIQCYHLHLPTCSVTSDKWQFFGWHAASVHGYRGTKCFLLTAEVLKLWTDCPAKNSFEQKVVLISRAFLQTSGNSR